MRTVGLLVVGFIVGTLAMNCGKKVESAPTPVNPQITDAVTQVKPVEVADAGVVPVSEVKPDPEPKPVEVQSVPVSK